MDIQKMKTLCSDESIKVATLWWARWHWPREIRKLAFSFVEEGERFFMTQQDIWMRHEPSSLWVWAWINSNNPTMLARYAVEIGSKSYDTIFRVLRLDQSMLPRFKNNNSMNRTFVFLNSILGISDYEPYSAENSSSMFTSYRKLKTDVFEWMLPIAKFPSDWDSEIYLEIELQRCCLFTLLSNGNKVNEFKQNRPVLSRRWNEPKWTYPGHSPSLRIECLRSERTWYIRQIIPCEVQNS